MNHPELVCVENPPIVENPMCECIAHRVEEDLNRFTYALIEITPPLDDDSCYRLANHLLPFCMKISGLDITVEAVKQKSVTAVKYLLQLPSGETFLFSGWPDFQLLQYYSGISRRLRNKVLREERVRGIGEVQSPPGTSVEAKTAALAQAGVYAIGQFKHVSNRHKVRSVATVILYNDLSHSIISSVCSREIISVGAFDMHTHSLCTV